MTGVNPAVQQTARNGETQPDTSPSTGASQPPNIRNFKLNHPKNYIAVPLALAGAADTDFLIREYAVNLPRRAIRGARETNLISKATSKDPVDSSESSVVYGDSYRLTGLGEAIVAIAVQEYGSPRAAVEAFEPYHGSPERFVAAFPEWRGIAQRIAFQYSVAQELVSFLREQGSLQLHELTWLLWKRNPALVAGVFLDPDATLDAQCGDRPSSSALRDPSVYMCETTFQFKAFLYHCGLVDSRGDYSSQLDPVGDTWALDNSV